MKKRGEITVFLSLTIVCMISLFSGLLESARTAGARLYLETAANSSMDSVMSQYNRNLWDMYHLLFLESESEAAVLHSFETYLDYYLKQENWYPMSLQETELIEKTSMTDNGGEALEKEIISYITYCIPEIAGEISGNSEEAVQAEKTVDFQKLFRVCRQTGKKTVKLEKKRKEAEMLLKTMNGLIETMKEKTEEEDDGIVDVCEELLGEIDKFPQKVNEYEKELGQVLSYKKELETSGETETADSDTSTNMEQELSAYALVSDAAAEQLIKYRETENKLKEEGEKIEELMDYLESAESPDWGYVDDILQEIEIPEESVRDAENEQKAKKLDRLEELLSNEWLKMVVPREKEISNKQMVLTNIPSVQAEKTNYSDEKDFLETGMINEYCLLYFDSFLEENERGAQKEKKAFLYEQEYLLCGQDSDLENLKKTVEKLMSIRGAVNLLYLLSTPERKAEADRLAAAVSGGNIPIQFIMSFFIMTMWALGEAIYDVRCLLAGGGVPFFKTQTTWRLSLEDLLELKFLEDTEPKETSGKTYREYMRIMFFLLDEQERNYRIMDLIQWNVRSIQRDFAAADCFGEIKIKAAVKNRHVFAMQSEYTKIIEAEGSY